MPAGELQPCDWGATTQWEWVREKKAKNTKPARNHANEFSSEREGFMTLNRDRGWPRFVGGSPYLGSPPGTVLGAFSTAPQVAGQQCV